MIDSNVCIGNDVSITNMYGIAEADRADTGGFMIQVRRAVGDRTFCQVS